jgi:hypothetical protein
VSVQKGLARFDGLELRKSQEVRLQQMVARARFLPDAVVIPVQATAEVSVTQALLRLLEVIVPAEAAPVPSTG